MSVFLDEAAVAAHLQADELIAAVEAALVAYSAGAIVQPVRQLLPAVAQDSWLGVMPAAGAAMGVKLLTAYPGNAAHGLPTHQALIVLFDAVTGERLALVEGRLITELRTAAVSAAATRVLAAPDARVLAILGSGVQARSHAELLRGVRDFDEVRVWSRTPAHAERFAATIGAVAMAAQEAVRGADVVVTATPATAPILAGSWLKEGALVNAVGWRGTAGRELDDAAMANAVVVDSRAAACVETGDITQTGAVIDAELGEILAGTRTVPAGATTIFKSVGMAAVDVAAAHLVYDRATG